MILRLNSKGLLTGQRATATVVAGERTIDWPFLFQCTLTHVELTFFALLAGMAVAIPLGAVIYRLGAVSRVVLYVAGVLQTIPAIVRTDPVPTPSRAIASIARSRSRGCVVRPR